MTNGEQKKILGLNANSYVNVGDKCKVGLLAHSWLLTNVGAKWKLRKMQNWHVIMTCWWTIKCPKMKYFIQYNGKWGTKSNIATKTKQYCIYSGFLWHKPKVKQHGMWFVRI